MLEALRAENYTRTERLPLPRHTFFQCQTWDSCVLKIDLFNGTRPGLIAPTRTHRDQPVPIVPAVQPLRSVQSVSGYRRFQTSKVPNLTAVQSSKVQRSMTTPRQTVPGFREFLKCRSEQQDLIFFFVKKKEHT
jgi:hypothetical protein